MALKWTEKQCGIYALMKEGKNEREIIDAGYKRRTVRDVAVAVGKGDTPETPPKAPKTAPPGEPIFEASTKGVRETLDPIILMRYDAFRNIFGWDKGEYPLGQFIDEASDLVCQLAGAVPPGFIKVEEKEGATTQPVETANQTGGGE